MNCTSGHKLASYNKYIYAHLWLLLVPVFLQICLQAVPRAYTLSSYSRVKSYCFLDASSENINCLMVDRYHCPDHVNPAEFLADLISVDYSSAESVYSSQKRINGLVESFSQQAPSIVSATLLARRKTSKNNNNLRKHTTVKKKGSWWRQFWLLLRRAWMQVIPLIVT